MKEPRSPCYNCEHRDKDKDSERCSNCERRLAYARSMFMIPEEEERTVKKEQSDNNQLIHLNNHLFDEIRRWSNEGLKGDKLREEIDRAKSVSNVAAQIINNANLALKAQIALNDGLIKRAPKMLGIVSSVVGTDE